MCIVRHGGIKIVMKSASTGFEIYGAPMNQASFEAMKIGMRWGLLQKFTDIYRDTGETTCLNFPEKLFCMLLSARYFTQQVEKSKWVGKSSCFNTINVNSAELRAFYKHLLSHIQSENQKSCISWLYHTHVTNISCFVVLGVGGGWRVGNMIIRFDKSYNMLMSNNVVKDIPSINEKN